MPPQVGVSPATGMPTKERITSTRIAMPISTASKVTTSGTRLGRISSRKNSAAAKADDPRRRSVVALQLHHGFGPDHAGKAGPVDDDDRRDHRGQPRADHRRQHDRQQHRRKRHPDVDQARGDLIDQPPKLPAMRPSAMPIAAASDAAISATEPRSVPVKSAATVRNGQDCRCRGGRPISAADPGRRQLR